jgi:hypothetical protein
VNLETCPLVEVPLPLAKGGVGVAQVRVTDREFPLMTADPPMEAIADKLDFPVSLFAPRQEGAVQLILGEDNSLLKGQNFFPSVVEEPSNRRSVIPRCPWWRVEKQTRTVC